MLNPSDGIVDSLKPALFRFAPCGGPALLGGTLVENCFALYQITVMLQSQWHQFH